MNRRGFLRFLALAPVAAPMAIAAESAAARTLDSCVAYDGWLSWSRKTSTWRYVPTPCLADIAGLKYLGTTEPPIGAPLPLSPDELGDWLRFIGKDGRAS